MIMLFYGVKTYKNRKFFSKNPDIIDLALINYIQKDIKFTTEEIVNNLPVYKLAFQKYKAILVIY